MADFEQAVSLLKRFSHLADFEGPIGEAEIVQAESMLGLRFPATYRTFLLQLGCGRFATQEFYGIVRNGLETPMVPNCIWLTLHERHHTGLPSSMVIVADNQTGGWYVIDIIEENAKDESKIFSWWTREGAKKLASEDFGAFLLLRVLSAIQQESLL